MYLNKSGWLYSPKEIEKYLNSANKPYFCDAATAIRDSGKGKVALLYKLVKQLTGSYNYKYQGTGDCVAWGAATAVDTLKAVDIVLRKQPEEWHGWSSPEVIYGGSRVQIGQGRLGGGAGSHGIWAARFVSEYGTLIQAVHGKYDLRTYSTQRSIDWGYKGVPKDLIPFIKEHPVKSPKQVQSVEEARDSLANGFPVTIAGSRGFYKKRDEKGTSRVNRSDPWGHQMVITGLNDPEGKMLVENSWPQGWITGPVYMDQPSDSFWAFYEDLEYYFKMGDSWSYEDYEGYRVRELNLRII
jgi:hypothetical protein